MQRETRINLLFGVIIIAIMAPGAYRLFKKKLDPAAPPMYLPEPVRRSAVYFDPNDAPLSKRTIPRQTAGWIDDLLAERLGTNAGMLLVDTGNEKSPVLSESRRWQLAQLQDRPDGRVGMLIGFADELPTSSGATSITLDDQPVTIRSFEVIEVPRVLHRELRDAGFVQPPRTIRMVQIDLPAGTQLKLPPTAGRPPDPLTLP